MAYGQTGSGKTFTMTGVGMPSWTTAYWGDSVLFANQLRELKRALQ